ncbi:MAG: ABC transporter permease [Caldilineaceae bacterium]|nr:ABC transporter permease [Caldilineaceae bacterium]MDE0461179.1 ABC transporter permease [Caldilineaceae bacterium]
MTRANALRELLRSGPGFGGVSLLGLLIVVALYVLLVFPLDFGESQWSNPIVWVDNPKAVPPVWTNSFRRETRPPHRIFEGREPHTEQMARSGPVHSWRFPLAYASSHPPTFLAVTLADVRYEERPPLVLISLKRPDGKQLRIYRHTVRGPREGESGPFLRYGQTPLRVQLSTDEATVTAVQNFLADEFDLRLDGAQIGGRVDRFLFGVPSGVSEEAFVPLTGDYEIIVQAAMREEGDSVGRVRFVVGGAVFGLMGTDTLGRDLARGLLFGVPVALFIGIISALMSTAIGTSLGIASGYLGGRADITIQRISDIVANVPVLPLLIFMLFIVGPSLWMIIFILVIFGWPGLTIQIRSMVLHVRTNQLVEAIQSLGASRRRVMFRHILPQITPYVFAQLIFGAPAAILSEAGLSFLGLGDPSIPTWGQILEAGFRTGGIYLGYWWWIVPPGLCIVITALTFMLLGLGIEPVVNPRLRRSPP